jgi:Na+/proline symporter
MAVCVQLFVGGLMLQYLTGLPLFLLMVLLLGLTLAYSLRSGMRASIVTDYVQMALILGGLLLTVPLLAYTVGLEVVQSGIYGTARTTGILDPRVAYSFGIVTTIGLLAGAISDQQYWQRAFSIRKSDLRRAFLGGAILFGLVPAALTVVGLIAAAPLAGVVPPAGTQLPMIGVEVIKTFLPMWAVVVFVVMLLAGLMSTLDSGLCAGASLYAVDLHGGSASASDQTMLSRSRRGMLVLAVAGLALAYAVQFVFSLDRLWWIFNGVASCFVVPTLLSVFWSRLTERGAFWGILFSLVGMIVFVYGNWIGDTNLVVASALAIVVGNAVVCWLLRGPVVNTAGLS